MTTNLAPLLTALSTYDTATDSTRDAARLAVAEAFATATADRNEPEAAKRYVVSGNGIEAVRYFAERQERNPL